MHISQTSGEQVAFLLFKNLLSVQTLSILSYTGSLFAVSISRTNTQFLTEIFFLECVLAFPRFVYLFRDSANKDFVYTFVKNVF